MATLASRIKELRLEHGLTQEEFGALFGIVKSTVSLYEHGKSTPDDELKKRIASHFGVTLDYLMGLSDVRQPYLDRNNNVLGKRLSELRQNAGYTQQQLAQLVRLSDKNIADFESGREKPNTDTLQVFADIFDTTVDYLLGRTDAPNHTRILALPQDDLSNYVPQDYIDKHGITVDEVIEYKRFIKTARVLFMDDTIGEEDKDKLFRDITELYWEAKEMNMKKRKKETEA